jgi:hypothetical protein
MATTRSRRKTEVSGADLRRVAEAGIDTRRDEPRNLL